MPTSHSIHSRRVLARMATRSPGWTPSSPSPPAISRAARSHSDQVIGCQAPASLYLRATRGPLSATRPVNTSTALLQAFSLMLLLRRIRAADPLGTYHAGRAARSGIMRSHARPPLRPARHPGRRPDPVAAGDLVHRLGAPAPHPAPARPAQGLLRRPPAS